MIPEDDDTVDRLIKMTAQTNLVAIDKTLAVICRASPGFYAAAAARTGSIAERIIRAAHEVGMCIPHESRATAKPHYQYTEFGAVDQLAEDRSDVVVKINFGEKP